jgi:pyridoxal phosphate-dependent aminotransferase EpsN
MSRIYLSPPHLCGNELPYLREALESNWVAPIGPQIDAFEREVAARVGVAHAVALNSGTAALHLAAQLVGVRPGDEVLVPTLTFVASANAFVYAGARPVFVDVDATTWTLDPELLREELAAGAARGRLPRAVVVVDLYGQCADYDRILSLCAEHRVAVIDDAAEALGATYRGKAAGAFGRFGVLSFNGNKIITTSGGGMLLSDDAEAIAAARHLATQARDPAPHYQHSRVGSNYRMSNLLAAVGRAQLTVLDERVAARRRIFEVYRELLGGLDGLELMPEAPYGRPTHWLTALTIDPEIFGATREDVRLALEEEDIEARPVWKPMHLQPLFRESRVVGGAVAERIFERGLCLPSGSSLTASDLERVAAIVRGVPAATR